MPNTNDQASRRDDRDWRSSALLALALVAVATVASAVINPLIDRTVHWDIMVVLMPTLFALFTVLFKKRWV